MLSVLARMIDIAMAVAGAMIAAMIHRGGFVWLDDLQRTVVVFDCMLVVVFFPAFGIYQSWRGKPVFGLMWRVSVAWLVVEGAGILMSFSVHHAGELSRLWLGYWAMATITLLVASKACVYAVLRQLRRGGYNHKSVAIVGRAQASATKRLIAHMRARPDAGFNPVCIYDEHDDASTGETDGIAIERRFGHLVRRVRSREIGELWLVLPLSEEPQIHRIVTEFETISSTSGSCRTCATCRSSIRRSSNCSACPRSISPLRRSPMCGSCRSSCSIGCSRSSRS